MCRTFKEKMREMLGGISLLVECERDRNNHKVSLLFKP